MIVNQTLLEKYGNWYGVTDYFTDRIAEKVPSLNKPEFRNWMLMQEKYSTYKRGMFMDISGYYHAYLIWKKLRSKLNQHHITLVCGKIGKGKSIIGLQMAALTDPTFNMSRVCYIPPHLFRQLANSNEAETILIDEGGNFFKSRNSMTKLGRDISQAFQLVRDLRQHLIICYDEPEKLDRDLIDKIDTLIVKIYDTKETGDRQFRRYVGFNLRSLDRIKPLLKKRIPIYDKQIMRFISWSGYNTIDIPNINDVNEHVYLSEKRRYLKEHMTVLEGRYKEDYEGITDKKVITDPTQLVKPTMKISKYAKLKNICVSKVKQMIKNGEIETERIGQRDLIVLNEAIL